MNQRDRNDGAREDIPRNGWIAAGPVPARRSAPSPRASRGRAGGRSSRCRQSQTTHRLIPALDSPFLPRSPSACAPPSSRLRVQRRSAAMTARQLPARRPRGQLVEGHRCDVFPHCRRDGRLIHSIIAVTEFDDEISQRRPQCRELIFRKLQSLRFNDEPSPLRMRTARPANRQ